MIELINMVLLTMLAVVTIAILRQRNLFGVVLFSGVYSFLIASVMIAVDAVDVALTEASVGAGISLVLFLTTLHICKSTELKPWRGNLVPLAAAAVVGVALVWATFSLSPFGSADTPIHTHVAPDYLSRSIPETGVQNVVASVLADYRSYDTLGEVTVIFTAGIGVMLLLSGRRRRRPE